MHPSTLYQFGQHGDGDFFWRDCTDIKACGTVDAIHGLGIEAPFLQRLFEARTFLRTGDQTDVARTQR